jgi:hypothetical protein
MVVGFARVNGNAEHLWLDLPRSVFVAFRAMYLNARDSGDPAQLWTSATVSLSNTGAFNVRYGYEDVPIENQFERVEE